MNENILGVVKVVVLVFLAIAFVILVVSSTRRHHAWLEKWRASDGEGWRVLGVVPDMVVRTEAAQLRFVRVGEGKSAHWEQHYEFLLPVSLTIRPIPWWAFSAKRFETSAQEPLLSAIRDAFGAGLVLEAKGGLLRGTARGLCDPQPARAHLARLVAIGMKSTPRHDAFSSSPRSAPARS